MSQRVRGEYAFGGNLPVDGVAPGTTLLVAGTGMTGARELALSLVLSGQGEGDGSVLVSTTVTGGMLLDQAEAIQPALSRSRFRVVDCTPHEGEATPPDVVTKAVPGDLTGLGIDYSSLVEGLRGSGTSRLRTGLFSVDGLLARSGFRPVSRFLRILAGRVAANDGLGVLYVDTGMLSGDVVDTLARLADGRIDVRGVEGGQELRVEGLPDQPEGWHLFPVDLQWPRGFGEHVVARQVNIGSDVTTRYRCLRCSFSDSGELDIDALRGVPCG